MTQTDAIFLIILNWNGKKDTIQCLQSLQRVKYPKLTVVVVDNGSTDDSLQEIKSSFPTVALIENKKNLGFAEGNNVGIRYALEHGADGVCLLNNDTVVDPLFIDAFAAAASQHPKAGIFGAKIYLFDKRDHLDHLGGIWNPRRAAFDFVGLQALDDPHLYGKVQSLDYVCGAAFFVKREVFTTIGLLEPSFFLIWEEADFCSRARSAGYEILSIPDAKIWHKGSASFIHKPHSTYFWWRNRLLWIERNCSQKEKTTLYKTVLIKEIFHIAKLKWIKSMELFLFGFCFSESKQKKKKEKLLQYKAAWQGITDFCKKKFDDAPSWIYKTSNTLIVK